MGDGLEAAPRFPCTNGQGEIADRERDMDRPPRAHVSDWRTGPRTAQGCKWHPVNSAVSPKVELMQSPVTLNKSPNP